MDMTDVRHYDDSNEISIKISALEETFESSPNKTQNTSDKIENMVHPFVIQHINLINRTEKKLINTLHLIQLLPLQVKPLKVLLQHQ